LICPRKKRRRKREVRIGIKLFIHALLSRGEEEEEGGRDY
jgi:hypothetical protein